MLSHWGKKGITDTHIVWLTKVCVSIILDFDFGTLSEIAKSLPREESPSLDGNFCNYFTEIPERLSVQPIQSNTQN